MRAVLAVVAHLVALAAVVAGLRGWYLLLAGATTPTVVRALAISAPLLVVAMGLAHLVIRLRTHLRGSEIVMATWGPLFLSFVPIAGPILALGFALQLLRGRTVSFRSGPSAYYAAQQAHDSQRVGLHALPAALLLLAMALTHAAVHVGLRYPDQMADMLQIEPIVNEWRGDAPLDCSRSQRFRATDRSFRLDARAPLIRARGRCSVTLVRCAVQIASRIQIEDSATLTVTGGTITSTATAIGVVDTARAHLKNVTVRATNAIYTDGEAVVVLDGVKLQAKNKSIHAAGSSVVLHRGLLGLGKPYRHGKDAVIRQLRPGEHPMKVVRQLRSR